MVVGKQITVPMKGFSDIKDITGLVTETVSNSKIKNGIVTVFATGSTASISTMEYEPALVEATGERCSPGNERQRQLPRQGPRSSSCRIELRHTHSFACS